MNIEDDPGDVFAIPDLWGISKLYNAIDQPGTLDLFSQLNFDGK